jgi:hypothetical protein
MSAVVTPYRLRNARAFGLICFVLHKHVFGLQLWNTASITGFLLTSQFVPMLVNFLDDYRKV